MWVFLPSWVVVVEYEPRCFKQGEGYKRSYWSGTEKVDLESV